MIRTVDTAIDTVVGQIKGRKDDDSIPVIGQLDFLRQRINFIQYLRVFTGKEHRRLPVRESTTYGGTSIPAGLRFLKNLSDQFLVILVLLCIGKGGKNLLMVNKFICT